MTTEIEPGLLANVRLIEGGAPTTDADVAVRPYPFPYRAAFTIANDCDGMSWSTFDDLYEFVNGRQPTPHGDGLGLEIGESFFVWAGEQRCDLAIHPHFPDHKPEADTLGIDRIVELGQSGWLTTLHSMGNWKPGPSGRRDLSACRDQAKYALDRLNSLGIRADVYVNHSGSVSNVGGPWGWYQGADNPADQFYCLDLLKNYGFRFFWIDACVNFEKFGDYLQFETEAELREAVANFRWAPWMRGARDDGKVSPATLPLDPETRRRTLLSLFNRTLTEVEARDGTPIAVFKRHRGLEQPVMSTFCVQVSETLLDDLVARRGTAIVYQHLGIAGPRGRSPVLSKRHRTQGPPALDAHAKARLEDVARRYHDGQLWVATTSRILNYIWLRDALRFSTEKFDHKWIVSLDGTGGAFARDIAETDLNGLSFLVPETAPEIHVRMKDRVLPLSTRRLADPAWPGRHAIYVPWSALEWPSRRPGFTSHA